MKVLIFGGTTEGRLLVEQLCEWDIEVHVSVATEYGAKMLPAFSNLHIHVGRCDDEGMIALIKEIEPMLCMDATHPYATVVTRTAAFACEQCKIPYLRVVRKLFEPEQLKDCICVESMQQAVEVLKKTSGNIMITTGSKELALFTNLCDYANRCFPRVLDSAQVVEDCVALGFDIEKVISKKGPFSIEENREMLKETQASFLVTKVSGREGGFEEKLLAAKQAEVQVLCILPPKEVVENSMDVEQAIAYMEKYQR